MSRVPDLDAAAACIGDHADGVPTGIIQTGPGGYCRAMIRRGVFES
jgi:hypothetical protein